MHGKFSSFGHIFSGFAPITAAVLFCGITSSCDVHAQTTRTASWFADRPEEMSRTLETCRDDPGRLRFHPDCVNAQQAQYVVAARQARLRPGADQPDRPRAGDLTPPSNPRYWADRPAARATHLVYCSRMRPDEQVRVNCDVALRAALSASEGRQR